MREGTAGTARTTPDPTSPLHRARTSLWPAARVPLGWLVGSVAVWAVLAAILPKGLPTGIVLLGIVYGAIYAILAVGIVLIYRGDRIINFAQAQIGVLPAVLAIELVVTFGVPFVLAAAAGPPPAIILGAVAGLSPPASVLFCHPAPQESCINASNSQLVNTPLHVSFTIGPVLFTGNDIV